MAAARVRPVFVLRAVLVVVCLLPVILIGSLLASELLWPAPEIPFSGLFPPLPATVRLVSDVTGSGGGGVERGEGRPSYRRLTLAAKRSQAQSAADAIAEDFRRDGWQIERVKSPFVDMPEAASWYTTKRRDGLELSIQVASNRGAADEGVTITVLIDNYRS